MSENWIFHVELFENEALIFGEDKDGKPFKVFAKDSAAEQIRDLKGKHDVEMRRLLVRLVDQQP